MCPMQNNMKSSTLDFITTKTDDCKVALIIERARNMVYRDIKEALEALNNHSFLLCITDSCLRLI